MSPRSLLLILAHPDDESFMAGGTMARYSSAGVKVELVTATSGDRGSTAGLCTIEELPVLREAELREALTILGVKDVTLLEHADQKLAEVPPAAIRRELVTAIRLRRPQVVISFDPNGANQHPDHIAISRFATDAVNAAADPRWYPELGKAHEVLRYLWQSPASVFELARTADLPNKPGIDFLLDVSPWAQAKEAALRAHKSQVPGYHKLWFEKPDVDRRMSVEAFRLAWGVPPTSRPSSDLFEGLPY